MKDEIKEILDKITDEDWYEEKDLTGIKWIELKQEETNLLYDYITNLQEKYEELKDELYSTNQVVNELLDERDRNKKAIEYIKSYNLPDNLGKLSEAPISVSELKDLLNILGGDDNE